MEPVQEQPTGVGMAYPFVQDEFRLELAKDLITSRPPLAPLNNMRLQQFANYVGGFWVSKLNVKDIWEQFGARGPRTTNMVEGWHNGLHSWLSNFHPTLAEFIQFLQVAPVCIPEQDSGSLEGPHGSSHKKKKRETAGGNGPFFILCCGNCAGLPGHN